MNVEVKVGKTKIFWKIGEADALQEDIADWTTKMVQECIGHLKKVAKAHSELNEAHYFVLSYEDWLDVRAMMF